MKQFLLILLLIAFTLNTHGQADSLKNISIPGRPIVTLSYGQLYGVSGVNWQHLMELNRTDHISTEQKERWISGLSTSNRFGMMMDVGLEFHDPADSAGAYKRDQWFGLNYRTLTFGRFPKAAAEMILFGNKRFAGQTVDLAPLNYSYWSFSEFYFSHPWKEKENEQGFYRLSFLLGHQYEHVDADRASIYTEPDGEWIDADLEYTYERSDTNRVEGLAFNGLGLSAGLEHRWQWGGRWELRAVASDLGVMAWNSGSLQVEVDSTFRFRGLEVENLFDLNDSLLNLEREGLEDKFFRRREMAIYRFLPPQLRLELRRKVESTFWTGWGIGLQYRFAAAYLPLVEGWGQWEKGRHGGRLGISAGGYALWGLNAAYRLRIHPRWYAALEATSLNSWIVPSWSYGFGFRGGLSFEL